MLKDFEEKWNHYSSASYPCFPAETAKAFGQRHCATNYGIVMSAAVRFFKILFCVNPRKVGFFSLFQVVHSAILILITQLAFDVIGYEGVFLLCGAIGIIGTFF